MSRRNSQMFRISVHTYAYNTCLAARNPYRDSSPVCRGRSDANDDLKDAIAHVNRWSKIKCRVSAPGPRLSGSGRFHGRRVPVS